MIIRILEIDTARLVDYLLKQPWHTRCEIIPQYRPPYASVDDPSLCVIRYNGDNGDDASTSTHKTFLQYSKGPAQGFFWDIYGDDFQNIELAIIALSSAPVPLSAV